MRFVFELLGWALAVAVIVFVILGVLASLDRNANPSDEKFNTICLEGVEYWHRQSGYNGMITAKLDTAGNVTLCEAE